MTPSQQKTRTSFPFITPVTIGLGLLMLNLALASTMNPSPKADGLSMVAWASPEKQVKDESASESYRECIITLLSGRTLTGEFVREDSLIVIIGINGIETTFRKADIANVKVLPPVSERFAQMREAVGEDDIEARLALVEWLRARNAYTLAIKELDSIILIAPTNERARLLLLWLSEYKKMESRPASSASKTKATKSTNPNRRNRNANLQRSDIDPFTAEQINLMRVYEIDLQDPPRIRVPDQTLLTLMARKPKEFPVDERSRLAILKKSEIDKLKILFTHKARDLYAQVQVLEDPSSIELFKEHVHSRRGWIINTCASTRCHGGTQAGDFQLINTNANSNATTYTNLYLIEQYELADGSKLINYQDPQRSPLLQMAMVEKNSLHPHPVIPRDFPGPKFKALFRSTRDRKFKQTIEWINAMYQPRPELDFEAPAHPNTEPQTTRTLNLSRHNGRRACYDERLILSV